MKLLPARFSLLVAIATLTGGALATDVSDLLSEAQRAYIRGDYTEAKEKFRLVQKMEPSNGLAYSYLRRIAGEEAAQKASRPPENATQIALAKMILEKVDFHDATLSDVLDFLRQKGNQMGGGKVTINFVQPVDESLRNAKITLALQKIPFTEVLRYIGELAGVQFSYEPYAIVVKPRGATAANPPPANQ